MSDISKLNERQYELFKKKAAVTSSMLTQTKKVNRVSTKLIFERNMEGKMESTTENIDEVLNLTEIRLDGMNIQKIENLDLYSKLEKLFLQKNIIEEISDDFDFLPNLKILDLSNNKLKDVKCLRNLETLRYLDLSSNEISADVEVEELMKELPKSLHVLWLNNNPINDEKEEILRKHLVMNFGEILEINGKRTEEDRKKFGVKIDPELAEKEEELLRSYQFEKKTISSAKFDELVQKLKDAHSGNPSKEAKPKVSYYEQLFEESKRLREERMKLMEKEFDGMKLDFKRRTKEIVDRSQIRREKYRMEVKKKYAEKRNQNVQTIPTNESRQQK